MAQAKTLSEVLSAPKQSLRSGQQQWAKLGIDPVTETPEQFKRFITADVAQGAELLQSAGFKPE